jgi:hypothetical protein
MIEDLVISDHVTAKDDVDVWTLQSVQKRKELGSDPTREDGALLCRSIVVLLVANAVNAIRQSKEILDSEQPRGAIVDAERRVRVAVRCAAQQISNIVGELFRSEAIDAVIRTAFTVFVARRASVRAGAFRADLKKRLAKSELDGRIHTWEEVVDDRARSTAAVLVVKPAVIVDRLHRTNALIDVVDLIEHLCGEQIAPVIRCIRYFGN